MSARSASLSSTITSTPLSRFPTGHLATPHIGYVSRGPYQAFYQDTANIRRWIEQSSIRERNQ
jgi:hypothetical protein